MEFACKYVYVPPLIEKPKRSALLPPVKKVRPRTPPPPPPVPLRDFCSSLSAPSPSPSPKTLQVGPFQDWPHPHARSAPSSPGLKRTPAMSGRRLSPGAGKGQEEQDEHYCTILPGHCETSPARGPSPDDCRSPPFSAPPLPPRPAFLSKYPEYTMVFPSDPSPSPSPTLSSASASAPLSPNSERTLKTSPCSSPPSGPAEKQLLQGNPNVILIDLDKIVGSCYFCQSWEPSPAEPPLPQPCSPFAPYEDTLFLLTPDLQAEALDTVIVFCVDVSGSMSITSRFVQEAVLQCVQSLTRTEPNTRVALVTFNNEVTLHGYGEMTSWQICGEELKDSEFLKNADSSYDSHPITGLKRVEPQP
ncbi:hypothetical protein ACEWY4_026154 [Coilia grayii]|uniref:VWFA domain-containing protein n=1 Tax=Coilia grayii TaxID=363190 RepID=A0ABD1IUB6_9TELE